MIVSCYLAHIDFLVPLDAVLREEVHVSFAEGRVVRDGDLPVVEVDPGGAGVLRVTRLEDVRDVVAGMHRRAQMRDEALESIFAGFVVRVELLLEVGLVAFNLVRRTEL